MGTITCQATEGFASGSLWFSALILPKESEQELDQRDLNIDSQTQELVITQRESGQMD